MKKGKKGFHKSRHSIRNICGWTLIVSFLIIFPLAFYAPEESLGNLLVLWGMPYFWISVLAILLISELIGRATTGHWGHGRDIAKYERDNQRYLWLLKVAFYALSTSLLVIHFGTLAVT